MEKAKGSSPPQSGGEVSRAQPGTERGTVQQSSRRSPEALSRARNLRRGDNMAEAVIWNELKAAKLGGYKFVRQMPIGPYFADFACRKAKLIVELDGSQHADSGYDCRRDEFLRSSGSSVLRFWSHEAVKQTAAVCSTVLAVLEGQLATGLEASDLRYFPARREER